MLSLLLDPVSCLQTISSFNIHQAPSFLEEGLTLLGSARMDVGLMCRKKVISFIFWISGHALCPYPPLRPLRPASALSRNAVYYRKDKVVYAPVELCCWNTNNITDAAVHMTNGDKWKHWALKCVRQTGQHSTREEQWWFEWSPPSLQDFTEGEGGVQVYGHWQKGSPATLCGARGAVVNSISHYFTVLLNEHHDTLSLNSIPFSWFCQQEKRLHRPSRRADTSLKETSWTTNTNVELSLMHFNFTNWSHQTRGTFLPTWSGSNTTTRIMWRETSFVSSLCSRYRTTPSNR